VTATSAPWASIPKHAAILLESDIPYDTLVQVMDRVRVEEKVEDRKILRHDLFPDISIGDAPVADGA
jgi:hypothetical protein